MTWNQVTTSETGWATTSTSSSSWGQAGQGESSWRNGTNLSTNSVLFDNPFLFDADFLDFDGYFLSANADYLTINNPETSWRTQ